jgi:hypothetical protein
MSYVVLFRANLNNASDLQTAMVAAEKQLTNESRRA